MSATGMLKTLDRGDTSLGVTEVISREIHPSRMGDYDAWFERLMKVKRSVPGYLGTTVISPATRDESVIRYVVSRFATQAALDAWRSLPERAALLQEAEEYSVPFYQTGTGLETWFALPYARAVVPPPRWKMAVVTFGGAFVISALSHIVFDPLLGGWSLWATVLLFTTVLVLGLTYLVMPGLTRLLRRWLYPFRFQAT